VTALRPTLRIAPPNNSSEATHRQLNFDELDEPLRLTTFVVVDLETTGGAAGSDAITEIGAVKVRDGEVIGEFATLVDPGVAIPPFIAVLTGITDQLVARAPRMSSVLPAFLEFAAGSVLVAHNAPFDVGFLKAECNAQGQPWPSHAIVDTAVLARRVLTRDEVPNCKLATLAHFFHADTTPNHRALADARATVDVLHGLLARLGVLGVHSLPELRAFTRQVSDSQRRKRHLADDLPNGPGVYLFRDSSGTPLYVGTSKDLRSRVRQYFVASETRSRMGEMVRLAEKVDCVVCSHPLEAQVRELRLITALKPRYNRRSKHAERALWLKLTVEPYPRLSVVRQRKSDGASYLGPLRSQRQAEQLRDAIYDAVPLRQCVDRLRPGRSVRAACALAGIGRCSGPCEDSISTSDYAALVDRVIEGWHGDITGLIEPLRLRLGQLAAQQRYEEAASLRDRIATLVRSCARTQALAALTRIDQLVAARADGRGGWELVAVRQGRLVAADVAVRGVAPMPVIATMLDGAEWLPLAHDADTDAETDTDDYGDELAPRATAEESELLLRWLASDGVRLVECSQPWHLPASGAGAQRRWLAAASGRAASPFADRRRLPMAHQPARAHS
jgi:DNA polymerase-3 subunit epsilon